ncbi:MAG TPA: periplasmic heavy metal sensor [Thermoanaerobaculia bacterium]
MKKRYLIIAGIVAIIALAAVPFLYAGPGHHHGTGELGALGRLQKLQSALNLSDQQVDAIKAIVTDLHQQNAPLRQQLRGGRNDIINALLKNPNDVSAAQAIIDQNAAAEHTVHMNTLNAASKALNVLTPEQRDKLGQLIAERRARVSSKK